jgi:hypothetical protein
MSEVFPGGRFDAKAARGDGADVRVTPDQAYVVMIEREHSAQYTPHRTGPVDEKLHDCSSWAPATVTP